MSASTCLALLLLSTGAGCGGKGVSGQRQEPIPTHEYTRLGEYEGYDLVARNDRFSLLLDPQTYAVALLDQSSGALWTSTPAAEEFESLADSVQAEYQSQLLVTYYNSKRQETFFSSYTDAVKKEQVELYGIENGVKVVYSLGEVGKSFVLPEVITQETLEKEIAPKLAEDEYQALLGAYDRIAYEELSAEMAATYQKTYTNLPQRPIYIKHSVAARVQKVLISYLRKADFSPEKVYREYEKVGYASEEKVEYRGFVVPVEYTLTAEGLQARIPCGEIQTVGEKIYLTEISLLPFMGAGETGDQGYVFLPDGQGALVDLSTESENAVSLQPYGTDMALNRYETDDYMQPVLFPVYGVQKKNQALFAVIQEGAELSTLVCAPRNSVIPSTHVYPIVAVLGHDDVIQNGSERHVFAKKAYQGNFTVNYTCLSGDEADYVGMAKHLRGKLFSARETAKADGGSLYLDTWGVVKRQEYWAGIMVERTRALTTYSQFREMTDLLKQKGVGKLSVNFHNWRKDLYEESFDASVHFPSVLGGKSDFSKLLDGMTRQGNQLFVNIPFLQQKNALFVSNKAVRRLDKKTAPLRAGGILGAVDAEGKLERLLGAADALLGQQEKLKKALRKNGITGVATEDLGSYLYSDFNENNVRLRTDMAADAAKLLEDLSREYPLMLSGGSMYALPYAAAVVDFPISNSGLLVEKQSVPFASIVLHGYISYAPEAVNNAADREYILLKLVELGANPRFALNYAESEMLKNTNYTQLYSANYADWIDEIAACWKRMQPVLSRTEGSRIADHREVLENVFVTAYENGTKVVVNYNDHAVTVEGAGLPARDFMVL